MEDNQGQDPNSPSKQGTERSEPVRSRWTPKPEQILILESIFNSGMVNPPKEETVRIRKLLEKFGSVGDANVFYWFQNRRSRSRRRQRQMQASLAGEQKNQLPQASGGAIQYESGSTSIGFANSPSFVTSPSSYLGGSSSSSGAVGDRDGVESLFSISNQMGFQHMEQNSGVTSILCPSEASNMHYETGKLMAFLSFHRTKRLVYSLVLYVHELALRLKICLLLMLSPINFKKLQLLSRFIKSKSVAE